MWHCGVCTALLNRYCAWCAIADIFFRMHMFRILSFSTSRIYTHLEHSCLYMFSGLLPVLSFSFGSDLTSHMIKLYDNSHRSWFAVTFVQARHFIIVYHWFKSVTDGSHMWWPVLKVKAHAHVTDVPFFGKNRICRASNESRSTCLC